MIPIAQLSPKSGHTDVPTITRREAIRRAALFLGVAISPSVLMGALRAATAPGEAVASPAFLSARQLETAAAIAERILPRTETPGALDVGVPAFIDLMVGKYFSAGEQQMFAAGLAEFDAASVAKHRLTFAGLSAAQQDALLMELAVAAQEKEKTFCHQIRELTVVGYFTSEKVGRNVLHYDPVPGRFDACVPLSEVGNRSWTK
ncbi:MAG: gluconate 2-dehydrogenase subunit 3 family protein [Undibacterium sp.]|nr:gluconate 2-dehydrogenase subunit 3 family protein [Opitutaceae bacterium]